MKLWKKLSLMTVAVLFFTTGIAGAAVIRHSVRYNEKRTLESYERQVQSAALSLGREIDNGELERYGSAVKKSYINYVMRDYGMENYILLCDGEVLWNQSKFELTDPADDRWQWKEVESAIQKTKGQYVLVAGRSVPVTGKEKYILVLAQDISDVYGEVQRQTGLFMFSYVGGALAAIMLIFFFTRKMLLPLQSLQQAAEGISHGELDRRASVSTRDEVGAVAEAFNRMAGQVEEQVTQLSAVLEQQKMMLGSMAHEMKTPMTSIIGYSDTLLHVNVNEEHRQRAIAHIYEESRRLERLSGKLMSLVGMYENDSIHLEKTDMTALFEKVAELERYHLAQKEIYLQVDCRMQERMLDADLFESLLINLIDNAAKASKAGDTVFLEGNADRIIVRDQGCGIPAEELGHVTEAFYMVDKARSRKAGGCGLGLALCMQIAALHGAKLEIVSKIGEGTDVFVIFQ